MTAETTTMTNEEIDALTGEQLNEMFGVTYVKSLTGLEYLVVHVPGGTTWMCENGYHGDTERNFTGLRTWEGRCGGTTMSMDLPLEIRPCPCDCHN